MVHLMTLFAVLLTGTLFPAEVRLRDLGSPAGADSGEASLCEADGRVYLSWMESGPEKGQGTLLYSVLDGETWSPPKQIHRGDGLFINWADIPKLAVTRQLMMATWLEKLGSGTYAYGVRLVTSTDQGKSWSAPQWLHEDRSATEHGFVSLLALKDGSIGALWLDGRAMANGGAMQLRYRAFSPAGKAGEEVLLDDATCECCNTDLALLPSGPAAIYRDKTATHIRDIYLARFGQGGWHSGRAIHDDNWLIQGCPVNGPALDAADNTLAAAWFSGAGGAHVRLAVSHDGGRNFSEPATVSDSALGRVDVQLLAQGRTAVSWIEAGEELATVRIAVFNRGMQLSGLPHIIDYVPSKRASGFPKLVRAGNRLIVAYRDPDAARVKLKQLEFEP